LHKGKKKQGLQRVLPAWAKRTGSLPENQRRKSPIRKEGLESGNAEGKRGLYRGCPKRPKKRVHKGKTTGGTKPRTSGPGLGKEKKKGPLLKNGAEKEERGGPATTNGGQ